MRITLAVNRVKNDAKTAVWYTVLLFGGMVKNPDALLANYSKGRLVLVEGRPQVEAYVDRNGQAGLNNTIIATAMPELLDARP